MCGDPPNIIIGTSLGYSFSDFIANTGLIVLISLIVILIYYYFAYRKELKENAATVDPSAFPDPKEAIINKRNFGISTAIFLCAIVLLVTHAQTGLTVAFIGVFIMLITLIAAGKDCIKLIKGVDYKTLLFFVGLFVVVGSLDQTGILSIIASFIETVSGGNGIIMAMIIMWVSALASAFIDNIPFAATMIPVIKSLAATSGVNLAVLSWSLAMGTDVGGSATPIGASANVVGTSVAAKNGHPISWGRYCKKAVPATILVMIISSVIIIVRYF